jgi:hypothetical protein
MKEDVSMKKLLAVILVSGLVVSFAGCKKKEPQLPPGMQKIERTANISPEIKTKWPAVKLAVEDKATKTKKEYTIAVGSDLAVPNTKLSVKVFAFLPDFRMSDKDISTASDKPNNPAALVAVQEPGKQEWQGWIYSKHPTVHPFPHEKFSITLVDGVEKSK